MEYRKNILTTCYTKPLTIVKSAINTALPAPSLHADQRRFTTADTP